MSKASHRIAATILIAIVSAIAAPVFGENYTKPPLRVMPADSVINVRDLASRPLKVGDTLSLESTGRFPHAAARDMTNAFELRIFRVDSKDGNPRPWKSDLDDCDVYLTLVFKHLKFKGDKLTIGPMESSHWLAKQPNGLFTPGYFIFIIEQDSNADPKSEKNHWEVFRLSNTRPEKYFDLGLRVEIDPVYGAGGWEAGPSEEDRIKIALDLVAQTISSKFNCYNAKAVSVTANADEPVAFAACAAPSTKPDG